MEPATAGFRVRLAALPLTVRVTAVTLVAVTGTLTSAWSSRCAELESTVPSEQADVPLPLPQPKVNVGEPPPAVDCSWIEAADRVPPSAQAPTSHSAVCPRSVLCCSGTTPTHRLAGVVAAASNAVRTAAWRERPAAAALAEDVLLDVGADVVGADVVGAGVVGAGVVDAVVVGAGVVGGGVVGAGVVGPGVVGAGVVGAGVVGSDVAGAVVGADVAGAAVLGVAPVDAVPEAEAVADALADVVSDFTGSHDSAIPDVVAAVALLFIATTTPPEAAESSALPAIKVTARRRPCAIRILTHISITM
jgi:hypothetical protein